MVFDRLAFFAPCMQGSMATVWSRELFGTTTGFEPGGVLVVSCFNCAEPQGGTTMVRGACCFGMTTVRTPGADIAMVTGSGGGIICCLEPPHALMPIASAPARPIDATARSTPLLTTASPPLAVGMPYAGVPIPMAPSRDGAPVNGRAGCVEDRRRTTLAAVKMW